MIAALLRVELRFGDCRTARQRRRRLEKIVSKLRRHFNISIAEVGRGDRLDEAVLGIASVGRGRREARETLERVSDVLGLYPLAEVVAQQFVEV